MSRLRLAVLGTLAAGVVSACAAILGVEDGVPRADAGVPEAAPVDAPAPVDAKPDVLPDAAPTICDPAKPFGAPTPLATLNVAGVEDAHGRLTPDELTIFFSSLRAADAGSAELFVATRAKRTSAFGAPSNLGATINSKNADQMPSVTGDGLTLYFATDRSFGSHIWVSTRPSVASAFAAPQVAAGLVVAAPDVDPYIAPDNASLLFASTRQNDAGFLDLFTADAIDGGFSAAVALKGVNIVGHNDAAGVMTSDKKLLYFASDRPGGKGGLDLYVATRAAAGDAFGAPSAVSELNTAGMDVADWISADRCRLYFSSTKVANSGDYDLFVAEKTP